MPKQEYPTGLSFIFLRYKNSAEKRGYSFELTKKDFNHLIFQNCHYCQSEPLGATTYRTGVFKYNGLDRKDNTQGYSLSNCVPCCKRCNRVKQAMDSEDFIELASKIYLANKIKMPSQKRNLTIIMIGRFRSLRPLQIYLQKLVRC